MSLLLLFVDDDDDDDDDDVVVVVVVLLLLLLLLLLVDDDDDDDDAHLIWSAQLSGLGTYCQAGEGTSPDGCRCSHCSQGGLY